MEGVESAAELVSPDNASRERIYICDFDEKFQPGELYSVVLMLDVLEHLHNPEEALAHLASLMVSGGILLVTVPAFMSLWTNHDVLNHHQTRYTKHSFAKVAQGSGLQIEEGRYLYHWTFR